MEGDRYTLMRSKEVKLMSEVIQTSVLAIAVYAHGSKEELKLIMDRLDKAMDKYEKWKQESKEH